MRKVIVLPVIILIALITGCAAAPPYFLPDPIDLLEQDVNLVVVEYIVDEPEYVTDEPEYVAGEPKIEEPVDNRPMIALTFDDGPGQHTSRILDVLERYGGQATFFVLGANVEKWQDTVIRTINIGSEVANHTWYHPELTRVSNQRIREELQTTSAIIEQVTGLPSPRFFRPPFGLADRRVADVSAELGYAVITWTLDTRDWQVRNADAVYAIIMARAGEGSVVLMHDTHVTTAAAMERVIPTLIARGYRLVTVSELLYSLYGELEPGKIYGTYVFP